jgi:hypothetical protein
MFDAAPRQKLLGCFPAFPGYSLSLKEEHTHEQGEGI